MVILIIKTAFSSLPEIVLDFLNINKKWITAVSNRRHNGRKDAVAMDVSSEQQKHTSNMLNYEFRV